MIFQAWAQRSHSHRLPSPGKIKGSWSSKHEHKVSVTDYVVTDINWSKTWPVPSVFLPSSILSTFTHLKLTYRFWQKDTNLSHKKWPKKVLSLIKRDSSTKSDVWFSSVFAWFCLRSKHIFSNQALWTDRERVNEVSERARERERDSDKDRRRERESEWVVVCIQACACVYLPACVA